MKTSRPVWFIRCFIVLHVIFWSVVQLLKGPQEVVTAAIEIHAGLIAADLAVLFYHPCRAIWHNPWLSLATKVAAPFYLASVNYIKGITWGAASRVADREIDDIAQGVLLVAEAGTISLGLKVEVIHRVSEFKLDDARFLIQQAKEQKTRFGILKQRLMAQAAEMGISRLLAPLLEKGDLIRANWLLARVTNLRQQAWGLGIENEISDLTRNDLFHEAELLIQATKQERLGIKIIAAREARISDVAPHRQNALKVLLSQVSQHPHGSREFRKALHQLDLRLGEAESKSARG